jgi:undecaprenyl-diphosphatase
LVEIPKTPLRESAVSRAVIIGLALAISVLVLTAWMAEEMHEGETLPFDRHVRELIHGYSTPALTSAMRFFSRLGSVTVMLIMAAAAFLIFWRAGWTRAAMLLAITLGGAFLLEQVLKLSFQRARPTAYFEYPLPHSFSFPSGHALFSFCFFGMLASLVTARLRSTVLRVALWMAAAVLIALIGFSRIYLGVHYPTDVIGGYAAAFVWISAVTFGDRWHRSRRQRE